MIAALATVLALVAFPLAAQTAPCRGCDGRGTVDCPKHGKLLELERGCQCSVAAACPRCGGCLQVLCSRCRDPRAAAELAARRADLAAWLARQHAEIDALAATEGLLHWRDATMDLTFSLAPSTVGRQKLDTHRLMHLYAQRIAAVRRRFVDVFALDESSFPAETEATSPRLRVFLFEDRRDYERITPAVTGLGAHGSSMKLMGPKLAYCAYRDPAQLPDDAAVHRSVAHGIAHLLLSSANPPLWIGNRGHGWLDEGIAHWFEAEVDGLCTTFCFEEVGVAPGTGFNRGRWKNGIRKLLEAGELRPFSELFGKTGDEFDLVDHAHAFAFVDWLLDAHGGPPLMELVARVKRGAETRDAMAAVYGFGPLEFDAPFRAWVKERYPLRVEVR